METRVLSIRDLTIEFEREGRIGNAVDGVSLQVDRGETLGLVGESGSGKSLTALAAVGLLPESGCRTPSGEIRVADSAVTGASERELRRIRGRKVSMVLQDPLSALNPVMRIGKQIAEALPSAAREQRSRRYREGRVVELLEMMRISGARARLKSYPHQFSGGMRQRVLGAIALAAKPQVLIADEPTTALDVTVQAAYLALLRVLQEETGVGILFISHDLGVIGQTSDRIAVMYAGRIVETGPTRRVLAVPQHPYARALLSSVPDVRSGTRKLQSIPGSPPSIYDQPSGCRFHPRCPLYENLDRPEVCREQRPPIVEVSSGHTSACHFTE